VQRSFDVVYSFLAILASDADLERAIVSGCRRRALALAIGLGRLFRVFTRLRARWLAQHKRIVHNHTVTVPAADAERGRRATLSMRRRLGRWLARSLAPLIHLWRLCCVADQASTLNRSVFSKASIVDSTARISWLDIMLVIDRRRCSVATRNPRIRCVGKSLKTVVNCRALSAASHLDVV
jgi:hypothetical protein